METSGLQNCKIIHLCCFQPFCSTVWYSSRRKLRQGPEARPALSAPLPLPLPLGAAPGPSSGNLLPCPQPLPGPQPGNIQTVPLPAAGQAAWRLGLLLKPRGTTLPTEVAEDGRQPEAVAGRLASGGEAAPGCRPPLKSGTQNGGRTQVPPDHHPSQAPST